MPTVPRASDIARRVPDGQQQVSSAGGQGAVGAAAAGFFGAIAQDADERITASRVKKTKAAKEAKQKKDQYEVEQARNTWFVGKTFQDNAFDDDTDYETVPQRYSKNLADLADNAADSISDPELRQQFLLDSSGQAASGFARIKDVAKGTEVGEQRAWINQQISDNREAGLTGDIREAIDRTAAIVEAGLANGYFSSPVEAQAILKGAQDDLVIAKLETMEPEDRLEALSEDWAQKIPSDIRIKMERTALGLSHANTAIRNTDAYDAANMDYGQAMAASSQIENLDERVATERRINLVRQQKETEVAVDRDEIYQDVFMKVRDPRIGLKIADIPLEEWERIQNTLTPAMVNNLYAAEANAAGNREVISDRNVIEGLEALYDNGYGDPRQVQAYFHEQSSKLGPGDHKKWAAVTPGDFKAMESMSESEGRRIIRSKIATNYTDTDADERRELNGRYDQDFDRRLDRFREMEGREPTDKEMNEITDEMFLALPTGSKGGWFTAARPGDPRLFADLNPKEKGKALGYLRSVDQQSYDAAVSSVLAAGGSETDFDDIAWLFSIESDIDDAGF